jgi:L-seryl-tRNA(Ser) seleniumtransferase
VDSELRALPAVDDLLRTVPALAETGPAVARWIVRREIDAARARILAGEHAGDVAAAVERAAGSLRARSLRRVVNATGVVLHTNLGRAPLSEAAVRAVVEASGPATVEFDTGSGERGARAPVAASLAAALCDAEDALVVNNNAGALLLALAALARGREVVVSRGELIEIGGEFRLPDVMEASGAILREVGTTNRTHARDYRRAMSDRVALVLKVHPSNYRIVGFTKQPPLYEIAQIAHASGAPLLFDIGSGSLRPSGGDGNGAEASGADEPDATSALAAGADLVCFSGDKLLGGPQAGIIAGRAGLVDACRRHPIARAVRADKLTLAALEATLWAHARGEDVPAARMAALDVATVRARAQRIAASVGAGTVIDGESVTGGGSLPGVSIPTALLAFEDDTLAARLRRNDPPVIARVERARTVLDVRTVEPRDDDLVARAVRNALR